MNSAAHLAWPFFEASHRDFKASLQGWTSKQFANLHGQRMRELGQSLGRRGLAQTCHCG
jgi:hypothetical protein